MIDVTVQLQRSAFELDLSFQTDAPVTGVFGPSGCGKTTLINAIAGLIRPALGRIDIRGDTLYDSTRQVNVPVHRRNMGVVFQEHRLFPHLSVESNLLYGCRYARRGLRSIVRLKRRQHPPLFAQIVELLEIGPLLQRRPANLSGGERQRIALGRALISQPRLLMLDEPLASLDRRLKQHIIPYLQRIRDISMVPMLYVSHDLTEILQLTDHLLVIDDGKLAGHGRYLDLMHTSRALDVVHQRGIGNVLRARVLRHDDPLGETVLALHAEDDGEAAQPGVPSTNTMTAPKFAADTGSWVSIAFSPWDIALARERVQGISIQNQLAGTVVRCTELERRAMIEVDIGRPILVELSRRSAAKLDIRPGQTVVCLIKSHAIQLVGQSE